MQRSRRENKGHKQPQHQAAHYTQATHHTHAKTAEKQTGFLSNCPTPVAHPATTDQSDAVLHNLPIETVSQQGMPPGREGSRCLTRQEPGRKLKPGPGCDCCHGYHAEGSLVAPPYESWPLPSISGRVHEGTRGRLPGGTTRRCSYIAPKR